MRCPSDEYGRRFFFGMLATGLAATLAACSASPQKTGEAAESAKPDSPASPDPTLPAIPAAHRGKPTVLRKGPDGTNQIALTVDDGYATEVVAGYVDFAQRTGIHLTFSPNGCYARNWGSHAEVLKPLIERGQVQIMNHTFSHLDLRPLPDAQIRAELERNDDWVSRTFGITTRPYYRPPFGFHDERVDGVAADIGYTRAVMWNGSYGDARLLTPDVLMGEARKWLKPGTIMLGHANHPTILGLFDQIQDLIRQRALQPVTLDEMFGTNRATG